MTVLTLFTAPKPFSDPHINTIQRNALRSWQNLGDDVFILVIGDELGIAETTADLGLAHLSDVQCNELGTPLISSIFSLARQYSQSPLLAYVNADILLLPDFVQAAQQMASVVERFLGVGQRWDLEVRQEMDFGSGWAWKLQAKVRAQGHLHPPAGSDYFIYPRDLFRNLPEFTVGRAGWDNWMIYHARQSGWSVIDATQGITIVHQNHKYAHLAGGRPHYEQPESQENISLAGGPAKLYTLLDADWELRDGKVRRVRPTPARILRRLEVWMLGRVKEPRGLSWLLLKHIRRWRRAYARGVG